jgi:hypothetical protein
MHSALLQLWTYIAQAYLDLGWEKKTPVVPGIAADERLWYYRGRRDAADALVIASGWSEPRGAFFVVSDPYSIPWARQKSKLHSLQL